MIFRRVKDLREDNDYKQKQLADYLYVKQSTYSDYENGKINIPVEALTRLADFYNTSVDYLLGRTDDKKPYPRSKR
ncbi:MAG: helix-turn-helix domain-containing protein [Oscillospiraceae bacterium]|nr:helix-turn-helix domain-containing protein [Oscillospiraceae bacterium]